MHVSIAYCDVLYLKCVRVVRSDSAHQTHNGMAHLFILNNLGEEEEVEGVRGGLYNLNLHMINGELAIEEIISLLFPLLMNMIERDLSNYIIDGYESMSLQ